MVNAVASGIVPIVAKKLLPPLPEIARPPLSPWHRSYRFSMAEILSIGGGGIGKLLD